VINQCNIFPIFFLEFFFHCSGVWTQGLHLEPFHQSFFVMGFFRDRVLQTICLGWLQTVILLISASLVARITDRTHQHPAENFYFKTILIFRHSSFGITGFSHLLDRHYTIWSTSPLLLCFVFQGGSWVYPQTVILLPRASHVVGMAAMPYHTQLINWDRVSWTLYPGWPQTMILPISTFQLAGVTVVSHFAEPLIFKVF
jgi:hypothetical protein